MIVLGIGYTIWNEMGYTFGWEQVQSVDPCIWLYRNDMVFFNKIGLHSYTHPIFRLRRI
jgi:hypothetical protein